MKHKFEEQDIQNNQLIGLRNIVVLKENAKILAVLIAFLFLVLLFSNIRIDNNINHQLLLWLTLIHIASLYLFLVIVNGFCPFQINKKKVILAAIVPAISIVIYTYTFFFLKNYAHFILTYYGMNLLFLFIYSFFCFLCMRIIPMLTTRIVGIVYALFLFIFIVFPITYLVYFLLYGHEIDDYAIMAILGTSFEEVRGYLLTIFSPLTLFLGGIGLFFVLIMLILQIQRMIDNEPTSNVFNSNLFNKAGEKIISERVFKFFGIIPVPYRLYSFGVLFCSTLLMSLTFWLYHAEIFPFDKIESLLFLDGGLLRVFCSLDKNIKENANTIRIYNAKNNEQPETILLVIGESANRDYMSAFNPGMKDNTTPWEKDNRNDPNFCFFENGYANFFNTVIALSQALTSANQYNAISLDKSVSIIDIANKAGYKTYFYSMQEKTTIYGAGITVIANQSNCAKWLSGYDKNVLILLKEVSPNQKNFVIIHLKGNHYRYSDRYPEDFPKERSLPSMNPDQEYKYSLLYTDEVLKDIFQYARKELNLAVMVYFSDHGEDTRYLHVNNPFYYSMVRIPVWVYLSPEYSKNFPDIARNLKLHQKSVFTNDLIFDTVHGLLRCESNYYNSHFDLSSTAYRLSLQEAVTLHGDRKIADDPAWTGKADKMY